MFVHISIYCHNLFAIFMQVTQQIYVAEEWVRNAHDQCYEYCFSAHFGLTIGTEYFGTGLFWRTVLDCFRITTLYIYIYIYISS